MFVFLFIYVVCVSCRGIVFPPYIIAYGCLGAALLKKSVAACILENLTSPSYIVVQDNAPPTA
jgi:hypothetical protein